MGKLLLLVQLMLIHHPPLCGGVTHKTISREDLIINNCDGYVMRFSSARPIYVDRYCNRASIAYLVRGAGVSMVDGVYERYGRAFNTDRYEKVLVNGTAFTLARHESSMGPVWSILRGGVVLYRSYQDALTPPRRGWLPVGSHADMSVPIVERLSFSKKKLRSRRVDVPLRRKPDKICPAPSGSSEVGVDSCASDSVLLGMLHPAIGPAIGRKLHKRYASMSPMNAITLDGVLDPDALANSLTFMSVSLSSWIGPEEAFYCCKDKYRLNFTKWPQTNNYVVGVQQLLSSPTFIGFLEELTGIDSLIPMTADDEILLWAGSSLIAVAPGGYLLIHNDFNFQRNLYRRVNVLLYLNEDWEEEWQGHLELWDTNAARCLHRILPSFNRMSIFTVLDDVFHGHPEPSTAPPGKLRYALQLVYYTRDPPATIMLAPNTYNRSYPALHGAIFQTPCYDTPSLNMSYYCSREYADRMLGGQLFCECNFRTRT